MDARIDPTKNDFFPDTGVFITEGASEGIDLFMEAVKRISPDARILFPGLSYYTGSFSATQKGLKLERLITNPIKVAESTRFLPTPSEMLKALTSDTKAIVLTLPNNPNGETYEEEDLKSIIKIAKNNGLYILFDSIFENMSFDTSKNYCSPLLRTAAELGALDRIVVVDSLSKTKNFAGERIGFMATTNKDMSDTIENIILARRCNPRLALGPLLRFEGLARTIQALKANSPPSISLNRIVDYAMQNGSYPFSKEKFMLMFDKWNMWETEVMKYYSNNLKLAKIILQNDSTGGSPDKAAYNTIVQMLPPDSNLNNMDYLAKLMFTMATYTQVGPCFGLSQLTWDKELGVWPRITYACNRNDLTEALVRLVTFTRFYAEKNFGDPNKFPVLNVRYDTQI